MNNEELRCLRRNLCLPQWGKGDHEVVDEVYEGKVILFHTVEAHTRPRQWWMRCTKVLRGAGVSVLTKLIKSRPRGLFEEHLCIVRSIAVLLRTPHPSGFACHLPPLGKALCFVSRYGSPPHVARYFHTRLAVSGKRTSLRWRSAPVSLQTPAAGQKKGGRSRSYAPLCGERIRFYSAVFWLI